MIAKADTCHYYNIMLSTRDKFRLLKGNASLKELIDCCPELWLETGTIINTHLGGLLGASPRESSQALNAFVVSLEEKVQTWGLSPKKRLIKGDLLIRAFPDIVKARMARLALQNYFLAALAGKTGKIRFNFWNGIILQRLLFRSGFERKPVSMFWYRIGWKLVSQKNILMRLVYKKGIYCFYSRPLVNHIATLIDQEVKEGEKVLEIAAGDGTLSRFLIEEGIELTATDDFSWRSSATQPTNSAVPTDVEKCDAVTAIRKFQASVVICSWPPAQNTFEKAVFDNPATRLYIVIGSRHQFASGNWDAYTQACQQNQGFAAFTMAADAQLSALVLPLELDNLVLIFRRNKSAV